MSINRFALRLAAVAALTNNGNAPYPTLAEHRVYDSRLDSVENLAAESGTSPFITVYTDRAINLWKAQRGTQGPRTVHLLFETSVAICETKSAKIGFDQEYNIGVPLTDSELETTLDVIGTQIRRALAGFDPFQRLSQGILRVEDTRAATADGQRLAVYYTDVEVEVFPDPENGKVPEYMFPLLEVLSENPDYQDRALLLGRLCRDPASITPSDIRNLKQQWPNSVAKALGY